MVIQTKKTLVFKNIIRYPDSVTLAVGADPRRTLSAVHTNAIQSTLADRSTSKNELPSIEGYTETYFSANALKRYTFCV